MLGKIFRKKEMKQRSASSIDEFRTDDYRVLLASPYFSNDLEGDIRWHKRYLKRLMRYQKDPDKFHRQFPSEISEQDKGRHFKEQVIDSIPFHQKIIEENGSRLNAITSMMPRKDYKRLVSITMRNNGLPEYFVYSKFEDDYFFVASGSDQENMGWSSLVKDKCRICDIVFLGRYV